MLYLVVPLTSEGGQRERETNVLYLVVPLTHEGGRRERDQCAILGSTPDK